jgi:RNA polymerase sigma-70 factor (ECF subfamily)
MVLDPESATSRPQRLAALVEDHFDFVWRLLRRLGVGPHDADDAAQQVFMIATRRIDDVAPGKERTFLYGTAMRVAANSRRGRRRKREVPGEVDVCHEAASTPDDLSELGRARALLDEILERMPERLRIVLVLAEIEELGVAEIAAHEGIKLGTAASRLRRARGLFRAHLKDLEHKNPFTEEER